MARDYGPAEVKLCLAQKRREQRSRAENMIAHGLFGGAYIAGSQRVYKDTMGFAGRSALLGMVTIDAEVGFDRDV